LYLQHFGLREAPFSVTPDPRFFFESQGHREALAALYYGITAKKGFVVITGEVGAGKTTLIRKVLRSLDVTCHSVFIFNTLLKFDELIENILLDLGLDAAGCSKVERLQRLNQFLIDKWKEGHTVALLIDEAQNLGDESLEAVRLLSNLETDQEKLLQIVLVGQPELDARLGTRSLRQLKQRIALRCRLNRLKETDVAAYIQHRLQVAGYEGPEIFSKAVIRAIAERSSGTPRIINVICDNALLHAFASSRNVVPLDAIREVFRDLDLPREQDGEAFASRDYDQPVRQVTAAPGVQALNAKAPASAFSRVAKSSNVNFRDDVEASARGGLFVQNRRGGLAAAENMDRRHLSLVRGADTDEARRNAIVSPAFFDKVVKALVEAVGPIAPLVLKERIALIGETQHRFPKARLSELMETLGEEISSEPLRHRFQQEMLWEMQTIHLV
jgi:general secretion pathway protein A